MSSPNLQSLGFNLRALHAAGSESAVLGTLLHLSEQWSSYAGSQDVRASLSCLAPKLSTKVLGSDDEDDKFQE